MLCVNSKTRGSSRFIDIGDNETLKSLLTRIFSIKRFYAVKNLDRVEIVIPVLKNIDDKGKAYQDLKRMLGEAVVNETFKFKYKDYNKKANVIIYDDFDCTGLTTPEEKNKLYATYTHIIFNREGYVEDNARVNYSFAAHVRYTRKHQKKKKK